MKSVNRFNFRAWDGDEMHHNVSVCYGKPVRHGYGVFQIANSKVWQANTLMQSTGLVDKHGVEIYEGDIVKQAESMDGVVKWSECAWWVVCTPDAGYQDRLDECIDGLEVTGNIYENPEILKGE